MSRFVVRPTGPYESDGYSVVDINREDERGKQIGRGLSHAAAWHLANLLNDVGRLAVDDRQILAVLAACADAHDDYLSDEEKRANRETHEKSAEQASKMRTALRECVKALGHCELAMRNATKQLNVVGESSPMGLAGESARHVIEMAREALGE